MKEQIENVQKRAKEEIVNAFTLEKLDEVRVKYLGKKGELTLVLRGMGGLTKEERPVIGSLVNKVRDELENLISDRLEELKKEELNNKLEKEKRIMVIQPQKEVTVSRLERDKEKLKALYLDGVFDMENRLKELKDMIKINK